MVAEEEAGTEGVDSMEVTGVAGAGGTVVVCILGRAFTVIPIITGDTMVTAITAAVITQDTTADMNQLRPIPVGWVQDPWPLRCRRS